MNPLLHYAGCEAAPHCVPSTMQWHKWRHTNRMTDGSPGIQGLSCFSCNGCYGRPGCYSHPKLAFQTTGNWSLRATKLIRYIRQELTDPSVPLGTAVSTWLCVAAKCFGRGRHVLDKAIIAARGIEFWLPGHGTSVQFLLHRKCGERCERFGEIPIRNYLIE